MCSIVRHLTSCRRYSLSRQPRKIFLQLCGLRTRRRKPSQPARFSRRRSLAACRFKRFELALRSAGVLPSNYFTVPGQGATYDAFGNMSRGQIVQILRISTHSANQDSKANATDKTREKLRRGTKKKFGISYFAVQPGDSSTTPGIYQRVHTAFGDAIKPVLIFVDRVYYDPIFDFAFCRKTRQ